MILEILFDINDIVLRIKLQGAENREAVDLSLGPGQKVVNINAAGPLPSTHSVHTERGVQSGQYIRDISPLTCGPPVSMCQTQIRHSHIFNSPLSGLKFGAKFVDISRIYCWRVKTNVN